MTAFTALNTRSLIQAAQVYADSGLPVFPCKRDKSPMTRNGFHDASTDTQQIVAWWTKHPTASIGMPTGHKSFVLDVDQPDGPESLALLEQKHGELPTTLEQQTGGNGRHLFFLLPTDRKIKNSAKKIGPGLDIRGAGGYVILPPSRHASGATYQWLGPFQSPAKAPTWLLDIIAPLAPVQKQIQATGTSRRNAYLERALKNEVANVRSALPGARNDTLNKANFALGQLINCGLDFPRIEQEMLQAAILAGLSEIEALKTIRSGLQSGAAHPRTIPSPYLQKKGYEQSHPTYDIEVKQWPIPNEDMFHGLAGKFTKYATKDSEADPIAVLTTFLCRFGAEVGRPPFMDIGNKQRCCLNAVLVGQSSKARKGTSAVPVQELFIPQNSEWVTPRISAGPLSSGEGLVHAIRDQQEEWKTDKNGKGKHVIIDPGVADKRLFILDQEFAGALSCTKRDGNTLSTIIRSLFDGGMVEPLTKTNKIKVEKPHVCIVTHITLYELHKKLDAVEAYSGFANRFLWVCVRRSKLVPLPKRFKKNELESFRTELFAAAQFAQQQKELQFTPEAKRYWKEIYSVLAANKPNNQLGGILSRAETYTVRLALTYALLDQSNRVDVLHLKAALALWNYCEQSASYIFGDNAADPTERKILEGLESQSCMDSRELYSLFSNNLSKKKMNLAVSNLIEIGKIIVETVPTTGPGRPKKIFRLNEQNELNEQISSGGKINSFCSFVSSVDKEQAK